MHIMEKYPCIDHDARTPSIDYHSGSPWITDFCRYVECHQKEGMKANGENAPYISQIFIDNYWEEHMREALQEAKVAIPPENLSGYYKVWSILVEIERPDFIEDFYTHQWDDKNLPFNNPKSLFENSTKRFREMYALFKEAQWRYIPLQLSTSRGEIIYRRQLNDNHVIPARHLQSLSNNPYGTSKVNLFAFDHGENEEKVLLNFSPN